MTIHSYVVARDYGFAPNPFFGICTLATCKPVIRRVAKIGDWIVGTGSTSRGLGGKVIFAMEVDEKLNFSEYWADERFQVKKPNFQSGKKYAYGDNIYHRDPKTNKWIQENSHHSLRDGNENILNLEHDTQTPKVLIGKCFFYWGKSAPALPPALVSLCTKRGHKSRFSPEFEAAAIVWIQAHKERGYLDEPSAPDW